MEDKKKSDYFFKQGMVALLKEINNILDIHVSTKIKQKIDSNQNWQYHLNHQQKQSIQETLHLSTKACSNFLDKEANSDVNNFQKIKITKEQIKKFRKKLSKINQKNFYYSFQKKPNSLPVIRIQEDIYQALCKKHPIFLLLSTSIDYLEYLAEKKVSLNKNINPQKKYDYYLKELLTDKRYKKKLEYFYFSLYRNFEKPTFKSRESWKLYIFTKNKQFLERYLQDSLDECI